MPGVVLAQALDRELDPDRVEGAEHRRPVLRVAEPEPAFLLRAAVLAKGEKVWVERLPSLGTGGHANLVRANKPLVVDLRHMNLLWFGSGRRGVLR